MRHAYLITTHKNFRILDYLMELLDQKDTDFYILVDKKLNNTMKDLCNYIPKQSMIFELEPIEINWGGRSQIHAQLYLLEKAINGNYDYYHFMQGSDFPIKSKDEINDFFEKNNGFEFIDFEPLNYDFAKFKCDYYHFFVDNRFYRRSKILKFLNHASVKLQKMIGINRHDRELYHGSALSSLTHQCAKYIVNDKENIKRRYKHTLAADEVFLQTEIFNSDYFTKLYIYNNRYSNIRFIDWNRRNGSSPYTFKKEDLNLLLESKGYYFARKFDESEFEIIEELYKSLI